MVTLVSLPKPFRGHAEVIQRNAIRSWTRLRPACQIILLGDDDGTAEMARECGAHHVPEVARNEFGTPLLDSAFAAAERVATGDLLCYLNADIILMSDFMATVTRLAGQMRRFLMIGQRCNVHIAGPWDFDQPDWEHHLRSYARRHGTLSGLFYGADYFVFTRGLWQTLPPLAIGRYFWDTWLIFRARSLGVPVFDATDCVVAVHQAHDYSHAPTVNAWVSAPEARRNLTLSGGY
ncbi:MAG TPA: glycosyltransferase family A protein, partial [bacterium]|nr:glycosyltransferase family A protein [bacterium]